MLTENDGKRAVGMGYVDGGVTEISSVRLKKILLHLAKGGPACSSACLLSTLSRWFKDSVLNSVGDCHRTERSPWTWRHLERVGSRGAAAGGKRVYLQTVLRDRFFFMGVEHHGRAQRTYSQFGVIHSHSQRVKSSSHEQKPEPDCASTWAPEAQIWCDQCRIFAAESSLRAPGFWRWFRQSRSLDCSGSNEVARDLDLAHRDRFFG